MNRHFIFLFAFFYVFIGYSQIAIYPSVAMNSSSVITDDENLVYDRALTYSGGIFVLKRLSTRWALNTGLSFDVKGFESHGKGPYDWVSERYYYLNLIPEVEYFIGGRVSLAMGINSGIKLQEHFKRDDINIEPYRPLTNLIDLGYRTGINLYISRLKFSFHLNNSILPISTYHSLDSLGNYIGDFNIRNNIIQFGVGFRV